jgi:hypothetical protein
MKKSVEASLLDEMSLRCVCAHEAESVARFALQPNRSGRNGTQSRLRTLRTTAMRSKYVSFY